MRPLQQREVVVHAADHGRRDGEQLEILCGQGRTSVGPGEGLVGVEPGPPLVRLTAAVEVGDHHLEGHCRPDSGSALAARDAAAGRLLDLVGGDLGANLLERPPDQARDVHLRDPDLLGDLRLSQALEEAQVQDHPLAVVEHLEARLEHDAVLGDLVLVLVVVAAPTARRERHRAVGAAAFERLEHLFLLDAGRLRQLGDRGRAAELNRQLLDDARELDVQLLEAARHAHRPPLVAEVTLDLADDIRRRVRGQLDAAIDVEAVDRLDQADRADLDEVLELLAAVRVAPRERAHERHVVLDQLLARGDVALLVVTLEEELVVACHQPAFADRAAFVSWTQSPPSRWATENPSTTVSRSLRRPMPSPESRSSSSRTEPATNGPTSARISPPSTCTVRVTAGSPRVRSRRPSSASSRSSKLSIVSE